MTGAFGNSHLAVRSLDDLIRYRPTTPPKMPWERDPIAEMLGIPIRLDESMSPGEWRLVDNATGLEVLRGQLVHATMHTRAARAGGEDA